MEAQKPIILYIDYLSQPCRAVLALLLLIKLPFEVKEIRVLKGEQRSPDYKKINPFARVPAIDDDGFRLFESHAILRYLSRKVQSDWYPKDPKSAALVDAYLDWHNTNTRRAAYYFLSIQKKKFPLLPLNFNLEEEKKNLLYALRMFENVWLKDREYIADKEKPTIADISACCELMQLELIGFNFSEYPKVMKWMSKMMNLEEMQNAHKIFFKVKKRMLEADKLTPNL